MLQMICETKIPSSEWSQKVCTKWWKISRLGFEWIRRARENERKKSRERVWMWPRKTVHFILFLWFVFVHATFVLSSVLAALVAYFGFLGFHSLLFTTHIFSCTCNKTNVRMKREKTPKKYAKYLSKKIDRIQNIGRIIKIFLGLCANENCLEIRCWKMRHAKIKCASHFSSFGSSGHMGGRRADALMWTRIHIRQF